MKSWQQRLHNGSQSKVKRIEKAFAGIPAGSLMYISTPMEVDAFIRNISYGQQVAPEKMRAELAAKNQADYTCPVSTGIFLRIAAEAAFEDYEKGIGVDSICPFWRAVNIDSKLAQKLSFGTALLRQQQADEAMV